MWTDNVKNMFMITCKCNTCVCLHAQYEVLAARGLQVKTLK